MNRPQGEIPTEVYVDFLGRTIDIHWDYHATLMFALWMVLAPLCVIIMRFGKPRPAGKGITDKVSMRNPKWWWFAVHQSGLYTVIFLSLGGGALALFVRGGFSGSVHAMFGLATISMGCLQVIAALFRGTHGGKYYGDAKPDDPATWWGDHYNHTGRRRFFEAYHKSSGYFTIAFAMGAVGSGLMQYAMPTLVALVFMLPFAYLAIWILLEYLGRRYDGYRAVYGSSMEHPYNKEREHL